MSTINHQPSTINFFSGGFGLIEIVVVTAIVTAVFAAFAQTSVGALRLLQNEKENLEASLLAQEALEAVRIVRDESWSAHIAPRARDVPHYIRFENGKWNISETSPGSIQEKYAREIIFSDTLRDSQDRIVASGGVLDPNTRRVTARVSWGEKIVEIAAYMTNFHASLEESAETISVSYEGADTDADLANFPSDNAGNGDPAQTFTAGAGAINVSRIDLFLRRITLDPSDIYIELRASPAGALLGTSHSIASETITNENPAWVEFRFQTPVSLSPSVQYAIRLRSIPSSTDAGSGSAGLLHWMYKQTASSPYAGGVAYRYAGRLSNSSDPGQLLGQYDYGFRVYGLE